MSTVYIGIDPDSEGALVALIDGEPQCFDFTSPFALADALLRIRRACDAGDSLCAIVEKPNPFRGKTEGDEEKAGNSYFVTYKQFHLLGMVEGLLIANGIRYQTKVPRSWKSKVLPDASGKARPLQKKMARDEARRLYPSARAFITLVKHSGRAEALLMAHYAKHYGTF